MPENTELPVKRIFISYSWSSNEYSNKVRELAEELAGHNMDVELDQWSLKKGDNKFVYMERMASDPTVDKVIILLDKQYKEKADGRAGGVGTETTIMTPKVYAEAAEKNGSRKFIPVIMERDSNSGKEFVPAFLDGKIYIDLTDEDHFAERFEELVRTIHDKPTFKKPTPGKAASYLLEETVNNLGSGGRSRRAVEFLANGNPKAINAVKDYFEYVAENLKVFDFSEEKREVKPEEIIGKIPEMLPIRDEIIDVIKAIAKYRDDSVIYEEIHNFLEKLLPYKEYRNDKDSNYTWAADHYKVFIQELFIYIVATLLNHLRFDQLNELTVPGYYSNSSPYRGNEGELLRFWAFNTFSEAIAQYNRSQTKQYISLQAKIMRDNAYRSDVRFDDLMQADFLLRLIFFDR